MKSLISLFVKYPFYGKVYIVFFALAGMLSMSLMNKSSLPVVESRNVSISVSYQGATPKEMEEGVVTLLENSLRGIPGIKEHSSVSRENFASVSVVIENSYDVNLVLYDIKNAIDAISNFPAGAEKPVVSKGRTTTPAIFLTLRAKHNDQLKLNEESQRIEDELRLSPEISNISVFGLPNRIEMSIEIDETALERYGLTLDAIKSKISANNIDTYGGLIQGENELIQINLRNRSLNPEDIENIVVLSSSDGTIVRVKDIANVIKKFEDVAAQSFSNGDQNVMMMISNLKEENLVKTTDYVKDYIKEYNASHNDTELEVMMDFMDMLDGQMGILYSNGLMGVILVIMSLSLFLSFRTSLWVAWGLPMSFFGMFVIGIILGISMNMISLFGMILIIGILVDDGIVIGENIYTYYEKGYTPRVAAIKGTMEVLPAVFVSVLTTVIAFMPILFIQGSLEMMFEMAVVVILCLIFSVIESIFVLPGHLAHKKVLSQPKTSSVYGKVRAFFDKYMKLVIEKYYSPFITWTLKNKAIVLASTTAIFIITIGMFAGGRIGFTFVPRMNENYFTIDVALKPGTPKETTQKVLDYVVKRAHIADSILADRYKEKQFISSINTVTGSAFSGNESGEHSGQIYVMLRKMDDSAIGSDEVKQELSKQIGNIPLAYKLAVGASSRFGAPISVSIFSKEDSTLVAASSMIKEELASITSLYNIMDNNQIGAQELRIRLLPEAYTLGFTPSTILSQIRSGFYGSLAQRIQDGRNEVWFYVRYPENARKNTSDLENLKIRNENGEFPLYQLCELYLDRSATKINHFNSKKEINIEANMVDPNESVTPVIDILNEEIMPKVMAKYPDLTFIHRGQMKDSAENMAVIALYFGVAFLIITLILMTYFRSFIQGFLVLSIVPLSFIAAIWGHFFESTPVSMMSIWGMVALSGTIINNAVVFLSKYNECLREGLKIDEAIIITGRSRFRPIILTSLTTTLGLFPLIKETSSDATMVIPMAISLGYGILIGTIFILAVFPTLIKSANILYIWSAKIQGKKDFTPESLEVAVIDQEIERKLQQNFDKTYTEIKNENN